MLPEMSNLRCIGWTILKVYGLLVLLSFNKDLQPFGLFIILLWGLKKNWAFCSDWACFLYKLAITLLKFAWSVYYWIGGIFIFHGIYKAFAWCAENHRKEAAKWDVSEVGGIRRMHNRETGQTIVEEMHPTHQHQHQHQHQHHQPAAHNLHQEQHQRPADQQRAHERVIKTWLHCTIFDHQNAPRTCRPNGRRLVAHVDTGNQAHTLISKEMFEMLYPGGQGAVRNGFQMVQGATGVCKLCPVVRIQYRLDGVVGFNQRPLEVKVNAIIMEKDTVSAKLMAFFGIEDGHDILISTNDMQEFYKKWGYNIQPISKSDFFSGRA
jgi:hypothetical protein